MYGARPLKRLVQKEIGDGLARLILRGQVQDGQTVTVTTAADGDGLVLGIAEELEHPADEADEERPSD